MAISTMPAIANALGDVQPGRAEDPGDPLAPPIDSATLESMLLDPSVPDADLRPYLIDSQEQAAGFAPVVRVNPARVTAPETEAAVLLASLNGIARWRRQQRYRSKLAGWTGLRIVSEGDSWFQYPFLLTDVIDWLSEPYAILSLDAAGDLVSDMVRQGEVVTAVVQEQPHAVLLSGGGNDLLGDSHLSTAVLPFEPGRAAAEYLGTAFDENLQAVIGNYERLLSRLQQVAPHTPVLTHVYDWAVPANGRWLGKPLAAIGITDPLLQRAIVRAIVDRFHERLVLLAKTFPHVHVIDTRGAVHDGRWHDELHPSDEGFRAVARLFGAAIAQATGTTPPDLDAAVEAAPFGPAAVNPAFAQLSQHADAVLLREIGRRDALAAAGDPIGDEPLLLFPSSVSGTYPSLEATGERAVLAGGRAAYAALCRPGEAGQAGFSAAAAEGSATLAKHLAAALAGPDEPPSARTQLIATVLARQAGRLGAGTAWRAWGDLP